MITSKSLRWSGAATNNGRQRLAISPHGTRTYSFATSRTSLLNNSTRRSRQPPICRACTGQIRAISLWGRDSSIQPAGDFAKAHSAGQSSLPDNTLGYDGKVLSVQKVPPPPQPISAMHHTSDLPPPSPIHPESESFSSIATSTSSDVFTDAFDASTPSEPIEAAESLAAIPERIGYLKEVCGIDFGWGTSSMMEMLLEHIHIYGGFSWTASIVLLAITSRSLLFTVSLRSSDMSARFKAAKPMMDPARLKLSECYKTKDYASMGEAKAKLDVIKKQYGLKTWNIFLPILIQIPVQFGGFRTLRNMAELPVPALEKEYWLWTQDLTLGDPYFILPIANAAIVYLTIKHGGESGTSELQAGLKTILSYLMPSLSFLFISFQPGAVQLYFIVSAILAYGQARLITYGPFRKFMGLYPLAPKSGELDSDAFLALNTSIPAFNPTIRSRSTATAPTTSIPTTTTTTLIGPGGLKLYRPPRPTSNLPPDNSIPTTTITKPPSDVSIIDRFVDRAKSKKNQAVDELYKTLGTTKEKRIEDAKKDRMKRSAEDYEKMMAGEGERKRIENLKRR